jgi:hypothetical protein
MKKAFGYGGVIASVILIAFGIVSIVIGVQGRSEVRDSLKAEFIVGGDDMSPTLIKQGIEEAGLTNVDITIPSKDIVGEPIDNGAEARAFAQYMRIHALESGGGETYAQMGRFLTPSGKDTSDEALAAKDEAGNPVPNTARNTWVTETALSTALNMAFFAEQVALFSIVMGVALLLTGIGFLVLTLAGALGVVPVPERLKATKGATPVPAA